MDCKFLAWATYIALAGWHEEMTVRGIDFGMAGRLQLRIAGLVAAASARLREGEASR